MKVLFRYLLIAALTCSMASVQARPVIDDSFDSSTYKTIDFDRQCRAQYSYNSYAIHTGNHAYGWRCYFGGPQAPVDTIAACKSQWGNNYRPVLLGGGTNDWACTDWSGTHNKVIPVVVIASELSQNVAAIEDAVQTVARVTKNTQDWFEDEMNSGKTFKTVRPVVKLSLEPVSHWHQLSCLVGKPLPSDDRPDGCADQTSPQIPSDYLWEARDEVFPLFDNKSNNTKISVPIFIYTGNDSDEFDLGANSSGDHGRNIFYNSQAPNIAACDSNDAWCGIYVVGHETGHNFGLGHTIDLVPRPSNFGDSIMEGGGNQTTDMLLVDVEQNVLDSSPFFSSLQATTFNHPTYNGYFLGYNNSSSSIREASATEFCKSKGYSGWGGTPPGYANIGGASFTYHQYSGWVVSGGYPAYITTSVNCVP